MTEFDVPVRSAEAMQALGKEVASHVITGNVIGLYGPLGAGKTEFVRGFAAYFGIGEIASPTFILELEYELPATAAARMLHHWDLYRIGSVFDASDLVEECKDPSRIVLIEWADRLPELECDLALTLAYGESDTRTVTFSGPLVPSLSAALSD